MWLTFRGNSDSEIDSVPLRGVLEDGVPLHSFAPLVASFQLRDIVSVYQTQLALMSWLGLQRHQITAFTRLIKIEK